MRFNFGRYAIILALVAAFVAAWTHKSYVDGLEKRTSVVVVSTEVSPFTKLSASHLKLVEVPDGAVPHDAILTLDQALGHYNRALLVPGEIVRTSHLAATAGSDGSPLVVQLKDAGDLKARAMAIKVTQESGVANAIRPGDLVDVLVALRVENGPQKTTFAKIIRSGVPVLFTSFGKGETINTGEREGTVVLQVDQQLAEEIAFAQTSGNIWLLMTDQDSPAQTEGVTLETFLRRHGAILSVSPQPQTSTTQKGG